MTAEFNLEACHRKKRRGNQNPFKFFFARMLLIPIQWPPELCAHRAKRSHTQIREITIDANQQTMGLQAGIQLKLSKKIPEDTKQSSTKWFFSLDSLSRSHILSLALSLSRAPCYRQSIFKAETERYSQIQPMTVAPMSVDSILLLTCVSLSLRATDGVFLPESLLSSHPVGLAQWKHWLKRVLHCKFFDYLHFWHSVRHSTKWDLIVYLTKSRLCNFKLFFVSFGYPLLACSVFNMRDLSAQLAINCISIARLLKDFSLLLWIRATLVLSASPLGCTLKLSPEACTAYVLFAFRFELPSHSVKNSSHFVCQPRLNGCLAAWLPGRLTCWLPDWVTGWPGDLCILCLTRNFNIFSGAQQ